MKSVIEIGSTLASDQLQSFGEDSCQMCRHRKGHECQEQQSAWGSKMGCTPCCLKRSDHSSSLLLCLTISLPRPPLALAALFKCTLGLMPSHSCIASCCVVLLYFSLFSDALCHVTCLDILSFVAPKTNKCSLNSVLHMPLSQWDTLMAPLLSLQDVIV